MNKMRAVQSFEAMDGKFDKDDTFWVDDERQLVLTRKGLAVRADDQSAEPLEVAKSAFVKAPEFP